MQILFLVFIKKADSQNENSGTLRSKLTSILLLFAFVLFLINGMIYSN